MTGDYCQKCGYYVTTLLTHDCSTHEPCPSCAEKDMRITELEYQVKQLEEYMLKGVAFRDELQLRIAELEAERDRWYGAAQERMIKINGLESTCRVQGKLIADQRDSLAALKEG